MPQLSSLFKMLFWPTREDLAAVNRYFLPLIVASGGILGSGLSSLIIGGMIFSALQLVRGVALFPQDRAIRNIGFCFVFFFVVEFLADTLNFNGIESWREMAENLPLLGFLPLYAVIVAERNAIRNNIEIAAIAASFIVFIIAILQFQFLGARALGGAGNAGVFGVMCLLVCSVDFLAMLRHHGIKRALAGFALLAASCALILSGMRSLWPMLIVLPLIILLVYGRCLHVRISKKFLCGAVALLIGAGFMFYQPMQNRIGAGLKDFDQLYNKNYATSLGQRVAIWEAGRVLVAEKPLFGQGAGKSKQLLTQKTQELTGTPLYASHYHNALLTTWVRSGLLGVLALLLVFIVPLVSASKNLSDETSIYSFALLVSLELSYIASGLFGLALGHDILDTVFIGSMAIALSMIFRKDSSQS